MRLFTALDLPANILFQMEQLLAELRPEADIQWSPLENLHITTKFIGEWPDERLDQLDGVLRRLRFTRPIEIGLHDLGWFPDARAPRVLWAGVQGGEALSQMAERMEEALVPLGVARQADGFSPHLTLARVKTVTSLQRLHAKVEELQATGIGTFQVTNFYLYRSEPGANASIYRKLRTYQIQS